MALATRSLSANTVSTGVSAATSLSVSPTGMVTDDWLIFAVVSVGGAATHSNTAGSCTQVGSQLTQGNTTTLSLWKRKAGASEAGPYTFGFGASLRAVVIARAYSGGDTSNIVESSPTLVSDSAQSLAVTGVDPAADGGWHLLLEAANSVAGGATNFSQPTNYTERHDVASAHPSNANACLGFAERVLPDAAATGNQTFTISGGVNRAIVGGSILLKPAGGGGGGGSALPQLGLWRNKPGDGTWRDRLDADEAEFGPFAGHWSNYKAAGAAGTLNAAEQTALAEGKLLHVYWKPQAAGGTWAQVASGSRNTQIDAAATSIKAQAQDIWLTIHHEPENDVGGAGSGMTATDYRGMWAKVRERFDLASVTNVTWVWVFMTHLAQPALLPDLWPGNTYVDIVAPQPYITCSVTASTLATKWTDCLDWLQTNRDASHAWSWTDRPIAITEWGADLGGNDWACGTIPPGETQPGDRGTTTHRKDAIDGIAAILSTLASKNVVELRYFNAGSDWLEAKPATDAVAFQALKDATEAASGDTTVNAVTATVTAGAQGAVATGAAASPTAQTALVVVTAAVGVAEDVTVTAETALVTGAAQAATATVPGFPTAQTALVTAAAQNATTIVGTATPTAQTALVDVGAVTASTSPAPTGGIAWSGYTWNPREQGSSNPGPNLWKATNAVVNGAGQLVLTVNQQTGSWYCVEVVGPHLGYGTYSWQIASPVHDFDRHLVLSLFTYDEAAGPFFREIDLEIAQFSAAASERGWMTLQPGGANKWGWFNPRGTQPNTFGFTWAAGKIRWEARDATGRVVESFLCTTDVPTPGTNALVRMNLWLFGGTAPTDGQPRSVAFDSFTFTAAAPVADRAPTAHLVDTFPSGSFSSLGQSTAKGRFTNTFGATAPAIVGGRGRLTLASGAAAYTGIGSGPQSDPTRAFDLTASEVLLEWVTLPSVGNGTTEAVLECRVDPDTSQNVVKIGKSGTQLVTSWVSGGTPDATFTAYDDTLMRWWRVREAAGTLYWETSPNGTTAWTARRTAATPITVTAVFPYVIAGHYGTEPDPGIAEFDNVNEPTIGGIAMGAGYPYLGYPGSLMQLPSPAPGYEPVDIVRGATHELLAGGNVRDRIGCRRRFTLNWPAMSDANWSLLRSLTRLPGPYRYMDPLEKNLLTENQSSGTDELRTTDGVVARNQGTVSSSTTFFRSWQRSIAWATGTALAASGRGFTLQNPAVDSTWAAVRPSVQYTLSGYLRSTAAVSMEGLIDWFTAVGGYITTSGGGTAVALSTSNFNTRVTVTATAPANAAYGIGAFANTTTTGAAITVFADELQLEEGTSASSYRLGVGTPLVSVDSLGHTVPLADGTVGYALHEVELQILEL